MRKGVVVEDVNQRHLPNGHDQATGRDLTAELIRSSLDGRLVSPELDGLAQKGPRTV